MNIDHMKYRDETPVEEMIRDFTAFGNPYLLACMTLLLAPSWIVVISIMAVLVLVELIGSGIKLLFYRPRPNGQTYRTIFGKLQAASFPSLHVARVACVCLILAWLQTSLPKQILLLVLVISIPFTRIWLKKHHLSDVIGGLILGIGGMGIYIILFGAHV